MPSQIAATPVLKGKDAIRAIEAINRKPSDASKKGAEILKKKFEGMVKK